MKSAWILSDDYIFNGRDFWKCSACGHLQILSLSGSGMRYCEQCQDRKELVHRINKPKPTPILPRW